MTLDARLLAALRTAEDAIPLGDLATRLGRPRAEVLSRLEALRRLGYDIAADPHQGHRLLSAPDLLHADEIQSLLPPSAVIGREIHVFLETASTNDVAEKLALDGVAEGVVVIAESQTRGRGRLGRAWVSPRGLGLWLTVLLRPPLAPRAATQLTVAAATGTARAIRRQTGLTPEIKWPNDVLLQGRKVCGVLTELSAELDHVKFVLVGLGLNVNLTAADFPPEVRELATSLRLATGRAQRRAELAAVLLEELDRDYARVCRGEFAAVAEEWATQCATLGQRVRIRLGDRIIIGHAESLDDDGALLLRTEHGRLERIVGGDVTVEKE
jgi:BirA family biotin operon repressor/biotin-[acetyl-CoA-carboxylase] ligase